MNSKIIFTLVSLLGPLLNAFLLLVYLPITKSGSDFNFIEVSFYSSLFIGPIATLIINDLLRSTVNSHPIDPRNLAIILVLHFSLIIFFYFYLSYDDLLILGLSVIGDLSFLIVKCYLLASLYDIFKSKLASISLSLFIWLFSKLMLLIVFANSEILQWKWLHTVLIVLISYILISLFALIVLFIKTNRLQSKNWKTHYSTYLISAVNSVPMFFIPALNDYDHGLNISNDFILLFSRLLLFSNLLIGVLLERSFSKEFTKVQGGMWFSGGCILVAMSIGSYYVGIVSLSFTLLLLSKQMIRPLWARKEFIGTFHIRYQVFNASFVCLMLLLGFLVFQSQTSLYFVIYGISNITAFVYFGNFIGIKRVFILTFMTILLLLTVHV